MVDRLRAIDTHQHLWEIDRLSYSWCSSNPTLNRSFTVEDYERAADGLGIERTIFVEADVDEPFLLEETKYVAALAQQNTSSRPIAGIVARVRPESSHFAKDLESISSNDLVRGVRRVLHTEPDDLSTSRLFRDNVRLLSDYNLSFDLCVLARQLPQAIAIVDDCPRVSFILDHVGNPLLRERRIDSWRHDLREVSLRPNIVCKISGLVTRADHTTWTADDLQPAVEHAIDCFGWDRVLFGSDWPVCLLASSLERWVEALTTITSGCGQENQEKLFFKNASRVYRC